MQQIQGYVKDLLDFFSVVVIKDEKEATKYETKESYKKAHFFMSALNRTDSFLLYAELYTEDDFKKVGMDSSQIADALIDIKTVPEIFRERLLTLKRQTVIEDYQEMNNYYRMLYGQPFYKEEPLTLKDGKKVTELSDEELDGIYKDEIEKLISKLNTPNYQYLKHLGKKKVHYYVARNAENYALLYHDDSIFPDRYTKRVVELYYESLGYCTKVFYTDSFKDYQLYNSFFIMTIIFMTIQKFHSEIVKFGIRHEFIEMKDLKDFFNTYSVPFNANIPTKYLKRIVQNMNELMKHKGTNKVLIDVIDLFGFENMQIFKQYLVKDIRKDEYNNVIISEDPEEMYDMKFVEIPIEERNLSYAFRSSTRVFDYDDVTKSDQFWGGSDNDYLKMELLKKEFNHIATKYISITTLFNLTKISSETCYFINTLNELEERKLLDNFSFINTDIKPSGNPISLFNAICALQCLICFRFGFEDNIMYTNTQMATIYGFNFDGDINELLDILKTSPSLRKEYEKFIKVHEIPGQFSTKRLMIDFFFNNIEIKEALENAILKCDNYREYQALNKIHKYNVFAKASRDMFTKSDGITKYGRYIEYLKDKDYELAKYLEGMIYSENQADIVKGLDEILNSLELYLDSTKLDTIFNGFIQLNGEVIQNYIYTLINHFKSYTTQIDKFDVYYIFNDKFTNTVKLLDEYDFGKKELINVDYLLIDLYEYLNIDKGVQRFDETLKQILDQLSLTKGKELNPELLKVVDKYGIDVRQLELELINFLEITEEKKTKGYIDDYTIYDEVRSILSKLITKEDIKFNEKWHINFRKELHVLLYLMDDIYAINKDIDNKESISLKDLVYYKITNNFNIKLNFKENNFFNNYNNIGENCSIIEDITLRKQVKHLNNNVKLHDTITIEEVK